MATLPIYDMETVELNGVLFNYFPHTQTLDQSLEELEKLIRDVGLHEISPSAIFLALVEQKFRRIYARSRIIEEIIHSTLRAWPERDKDGNVVRDEHGKPVRHADVVRGAQAAFLMKDEVHGPDIDGPDLDELPAAPATEKTEPKTQDWNF